MRGIIGAISHQLRGFAEQMTCLEIVGKLKGPRLIQLDQILDPAGTLEGFFCLREKAIRWQIFREPRRGRALHRMGGAVGATGKV